MAKEALSGWFGSLALSPLRGSFDSPTMTDGNCNFAKLQHATNKQIRVYSSAKKRGWLPPSTIATHWFASR
jgi:hypothetical protein